MNYWAMDKNGLVFLHCLMLVSLGADAISSCSNTAGYYRGDGTYTQNLKLILDTVALNVTLEDGFYNGTIGQDSGRVYVLALCREGSKTKDCFNCINTIREDLREKCPNQTEAFSWDGDVPCMIRYSNRPIFGSLELETVGAVYNTGNITSNLTHFDQVWESLMLRTLTAASAGTSKLKYYGIGAEPLTAFLVIYALMQCTPDITPSDCDSCLRQSVAFYESCCHGKQGGVVARASCIFRWDLYPFYGAFDNVSSPSPPPQPPQTRQSSINEANKKGPKHFTGVQNVTSRTIILIVVLVIVILILISCFCILRARKKKAQQRLQNDEDVDQLITAESLRFDIGTIRVATDNFSSTNKLGQGGFGSVYKGTLSDGQEIAVKRLSKSSGQGDHEFKTEVLLVAKLQHRNLVRLLGFCLEGNEMVLIYEFVHNSNLDHFLFDPIKRTQLDWERRCKIIRGVARGLLYLHEDSRLRIIHRDLKAGNILLDQDMCPKIADFGLARLFGMNETQGSTNTIVGTYGYMAPEYAMHGQFSVKTDVFSYGVMVLEIISGQKNRCSPNGEDVEDLLSFAWRSWREGTEENLVDPCLNSGPINEMKRCINIGLLCVQEKIASRPTMDSVVHMLNSDFLTLPTPSRPAFFRHGTAGSFTSSSSGSGSELLPLSVNGASITELHPR